MSKPLIVGADGRWIQMPPDDTVPISSGGTGATATGAARANLGLKNAATRDVGLTPNDVAAGNRGLPAGGTVGQIVRKKSAADYDTGWVDARLNPRGDWAPNATYALWDYVFYQNATYLAKAPFTSGATFDVTKWDLLSKAPVTSSGGNAVITQIGDGSDGDLTVSAGQTFVLDRERNFNNITIQAGGVFQPYSWRVLIFGTLTVEVGGVVDGDAAPSGSFGNRNGSLASPARGGVNSNTAAAKNGDNVISGLGGAGGNGGTSSTDGGTTIHAGGVGGTVAPPSPSLGSYRTIAVLGTGYTRAGTLGGGAGGGAPAGCSFNGGAGATQGNAGSSGGQLVVVNAKHIIHNGVIRARGSGPENAFGGRSYAGGSGGGGGGALLINSSTYSGTGTFDVSGGPGGAGANGGGNGTAGTAGTVIQTVWS